MNKKNAIAVPHKPDPKARRIRRRKRRLQFLVWFVGILVIARLALPYVVLYLTNKKLATLEGYYGHIDDIDISLYRGAYTIRKLQLRKIDQKDTLDFLYAKEIDLAIEWAPVWRGELVGKAAINSAAIVYTVERNDWRDIAKDTANFRDVMNSFMPLTLNKLEISNCTIFYRNPYSSPELDMKIEQIHVVALNLVNAYDSTSLLPATVDATGKLYRGNVDFHMRTDPFSDRSKFDMNATVKGVSLPSMNSLLRAYANFDVNSGTFDLYTEFATKDGKVNGYVKPLITDLDIVSWKEEKNDKLGRKLYESLLEAGAWLFKNRRTDKLGSKVYIHGDLNDPKVSIGKAVLLLLQNAFITSLRPYIDGEISIGSVTGAGEENVIDRFIEKRKDRKEKRAQRKDN